VHVEAWSPPRRYIADDRKIRRRRKMRRKTNGSSILA